MDTKKIIRTIIFVAIAAAFVAGTIYALNHMSADTMGEGGGH